MKVWLCKYGETLPISDTTRLYRVGMLAKALREKNHEVIWWNSKFDHGLKKELDNITVLKDGTRVEMLSGIVYKKNLSIKRIINHYQIGKDFERKSKIEEKPDLIYVSMPTLDFAFRAVKYAVENDVKSVVDIRDLWPDVFLDLIPFKYLKKEVFLSPWNKKLKYILRNATLVVGITEEYVKWAKDKVAPFQLNQTIAYPLGFTGINKTILHKPVKRTKFTVSFVGTIGPHFDLETLFLAAQKMKDIKFNIVGNGDLLKKYKRDFGDLNNVDFLGWLNQEEITEVLLNSDIGIAPYKNTKNFMNNIPNKPFEYIAHKLPVLTCLNGATRKMLEKHSIGYYYDEKNPGSLVENLKNILENENELLNKKDRCEKVFNELYDSTVIYEKFVRQMEKMVK